MGKTTQEASGRAGQYLLAGEGWSCGVVGGWGWRRVHVEVWVGG